MSERHEPRDPWQTLSSTELVRTKWLAIRRDQVRTHTGAEITYTWVDCPRAVTVVPVTAAGEVVLLRHYRYTVGAWCWEVPAGQPEAQEEAGEEAAARELREEVGGAARELQRIGAFYASNGISNERFEVFLALGVVLGENAPEPAELLHVVRMPFAEAMRLAHAGEVSDGMSALSLLACEPHIREALSR